MKNRITICFILPTLFAGGAERVISFVSQNIDSTKFNVYLIVIGFEKDSKFDVSKIRVVYLNKNRVLQAIIPIIRVIIKVKPKIVVSSISHLNVMMGLISLLFPNIKFIGRHATITNVAKNYKTKHKRISLSSLLNIHSFGIKQLDHIICQSIDMKNDFLKNHDINKSKVTIIHNPITEANITKEKNKPTSIKKIITVGRLSKIKGQLRLLDNLSKVSIPFHFTIIGDGSYKDIILEKIEELDLTNKVTLISHTNNVFKYLVENDVFLQGSYSEGFPNALLESCVVGTPVIAYNVPGGTKEIIENGVNGYLVNTEEEFIKRLDETKDWNPSDIRESVYKKFNKEKIINDYEQLFINVLKE